MLKVVTPFLTSSSTPFGHSCTNPAELSGYEGWKVFDGTDALYVSAVGVLTGTFIRMYPKGFILGAYAVKGRTDFPAQSPKTWGLFGSNDGVTWTLLDSQTGVSVVTEKIFKVGNNRKFKQYKFDVYANNGDADRLAIMDIKFYSLSKKVYHRSQLVLPSARGGGF